MRSIFIHEYVSGGGELDREADAAELLPMGLAMRDALLADLLRIPDLAVHCAVSARAGLPRSLLPHIPLPIMHPRLAAVRAGADEPAVAFVQRAARAHDLAWIVAPETDGLLAAMHEAVGAPRWVGCTAGAIRVASSKRATLSALAACGVPTPLAFETAATRWVVKPDDGAGAIATQVHTTLAEARADLAQRVAAGRSATLEAFVEGAALSISLLAGPGFVQPLAFNQQQLAIDGAGRLSFLGVRPNAINMRSDPRATRLHTLALDVARALPGLRGFVGIDLVWHAERGPVVIEVNPRLSCAYVGLSAALGRNLAEEILLLQHLPETADATR
jgi:predicted ATP-grasp superfamily ATP-dependent carboligase